MDEVNAKVKKIKDKTSDQLADYLLPRTVPVIIGNAGQYYLIDHHHLTKSMWLAKGDMAIPVLVTRNWAPIKGDRFWTGWLPATGSIRSMRWCWAVQSRNAQTTCQGPRQRSLPEPVVGGSRSLRLRQGSQQRDLRRVRVGDLLPHSGGLQRAVDHHVKESGRDDSSGHRERRPRGSRRKARLRAAPGQFSRGGRPARLGRSQ